MPLGQASFRPVHAGQFRARYRNIRQRLCEAGQRCAGTRTHGGQGWRLRGVRALPAGPYLLTASALSVLLARHLLPPYLRDAGLRTSHRARSGCAAPAPVLAAHWLLSLCSRSSWSASCHACHRRRSRLSALGERKPRYFLSALPASSGRVRNCRCFIVRSPAGRFDEMRTAS